MGDAPDPFLLTGLLAVFGLLALAAPKLAFVLFVWRRQERTVLVRMITTSVSDFAVIGGAFIVLVRAGARMLPEEAAQRLLLWLVVSFGSLAAMTLLNRALLTGYLASGAVWRRALALAAISFGVAVVLLLAVGSVAN